MDAENAGLNHSEKLPKVSLLTVHHSNRLETLAQELADLLRTPLEAPLVAETVVVQSLGMARWLSLRLAEHLGVCANTRFPFPAAFIWDMFRKVFSTLPRSSPFDTIVMTWQLMALLREIDGTDTSSPLHAYLQGGGDYRYYELSRQIASVFDQYLVYRPDWIRRWEAGHDSHWQAELWRRLSSSLEGQHWVEVYDNFLQALEASEDMGAQFPKRVALFGISVLSPAYLDVLVSLSTQLDVHIFTVNPCREYWGDIAPPRSLSRRAGDIDPGLLHLETGNSLLASLGTQGRNFIDLLGEYSGNEQEAFVVPGRHDLLHALQTDLLELREPGIQDFPPTAVAANDNSVQVHVSYSPMREVEILYDQLLALLETDPDLGPSDVIVMTPDIEAYAPLIDAVFTAPPIARRIPFTIADRTLRAESRITDTFFRLLDLPHSRHDASLLIGLLEIPAVARRFGIREDDLGRVHWWVRETKIRWAIDGNERGKLGLPAVDEHTWRAGLDRLLLGHALSGYHDQLFGGILPCDEVEGAEAQVLGHLYTFVESIFQVSNALGHDHPMVTWVKLLSALLDSFFSPSGSELREVQAIRLALEDMAQRTLLAHLERPLALSVVKSELRRYLEVPGDTARMPSGGVTFCSMTSMRGVPFKVVSLIGMNDGSIPRLYPTVGFDLMARDPRKGDRSRRMDDRHAFLEVLVSARCYLYVSYVGKHIRENTIIPPSVLVSELLDYLRRAFVTTNGDDILSQLVTHHPLQPFSRRYFGEDSKLFSYSAQYCEASQAAHHADPVIGPFVTDRLPEPEAAMRTIELRELIRFFENPARYFLQKRFKIILKENENLLQTREPFTLEPLARAELYQYLLSAHLEGRSLVSTLPALRARGLLPHGEVGLSVFRTAVPIVEAFTEHLRAVRSPQPATPLPIDLRYGELHLTGLVDGVGPAGFVGYHLSPLRPRHWLRLWLHHLALNALQPSEIGLASRWVAQDKELLLAPLQDADSYLRELLHLYWVGLQRALHFFSRSSFVYADTLYQGKNDPMGKARRIWHGSEYSPGEGEDPYLRLAFGATEALALDSQFAEHAVQVFRPIFEHVQDR